MSGDLRSILSSKLGVLTASGPSASPVRHDRSGARKALEGCWAPMQRAVDAMLPGIVLEAMSAAAKVDDVDEARPAKFVLAKDRQFAAAYQGALRAEFGNQVRDFLTHKRAEQPQEKTGKPELSLIEYGDMELSTRVERASARIRNSTDDVYGPLRIRLAALVREAEVPEHESPLRPAMFYRALHQALEQIGLKPEELLGLLQMFDAAVVKLAANGYRAVNDHLSEQGLSGEVSALTTGWRSTMMRQGRPTNIGGPSTRGPGGSSGGAGSIANAEQILQALYSRLQLPAVGAPMGSASAAPTAAALPMLHALTGRMPGGYPAAPDGVQVAPGLTVQTPGQMPSAPVGYGQMSGGQMPMGQSGAGQVPMIGAPIMIDPNLLTAINEIQKLSAVALAAAQQGGPALDAAIPAAELRNKLADKAANQIDKLTIEIVGLLFDRVNQDKLVPREIKELLQRLQFPLIKVALTDPELFVSPEHAARRLIDRMASTSVGWTNQGDDNRRYLHEAQKAVQLVLADVEGDTAVFERALAGFEEYLNEERTRDDDPVARAKRALAEAESREIMAINAAIRIRNVLEGVQVESYLKDFLFETWVRVLVAASLQDKGDVSHVKRFVGIVPDLVWSVQPKINPEDRKRLVGTIPNVLTILREGLMLVSMPAPAMQEFFARLMNSHAQAVKALELAHGVASPSFEPATMRIKLDGINFANEEPSAADPAGPPPPPVRVADNLVQQALDASHADVEHLPAPEPVPVNPGDATDDELTTFIQQWKRGDWFALRLGDITERVRLRWVSPQKSLYLFTPADGRKAHSLSPDAIRGYLRSRALQPVESARLFERVVQSVVQDLQVAAESAPSAA